MLRRARDHRMIAMLQSWRVRQVARQRAWVAQAILLFCAPAWAPAWATSPPWPDAPYSYFSEGAPLASVLGEFASGFSLGLSVDPGVTGTVNGRFSSANPTEFLSRLGGVYGFTWYTHGGTLHVSRTRDAVMRTVPIPAAGLGKLRQTLIDLGIVDSRFGWGELPDHGVLLISGPVSYVNLVETTLRELPSQHRSAYQVQVFRLRHASADDRVIQFRDRQITQPGLTSVLRGLMAGGTPGLVNERLEASPGAIAPQPALGASAPTSPPASRAAPAGSGPGSGAGARPGAGQGASIQADSRLNAIIVTDTPERIGLYERLITQLDVPSPLIEIEALIIDVNSDRARELGINWSLRSGAVSATLGEPQPIRQGMLSLNVDSAQRGRSPADLDSYFLAQIRLLESTGDARIQSRPSVLTTDNIGALLDLSETFYIRVQGERVASVAPVTVGTTLRVTPRLVDGVQATIQLTVDIEDGQIQDRQVDSLPTVRRSAVSTQAVVRQDEALVIAGYSSDQVIASEQKVPLLSDLPWVGPLFSSKARLVQKRERIFLIRPRLVSDASGASVPSPRTLAP